MTPRKDISWIGIGALIVAFLFGLLGGLDLFW